MPDDKIGLNKIEVLPGSRIEGGGFGVGAETRIERPQSDSERKVAVEKMDPAYGAGLSALPADGATDSLGDQRQKEIEDILSKDVADMYLAMPAERRVEFKAVGEATARKINDLLSSPKVQVMKIVDLIKKWLSMIPGVNKYFIEQEAKIKADEIVKARIL